MKKLSILAVLAIAGVVAGVVACGDSKPADSPNSTTTTTTSSGAADSAAPAASATPAK